MLHFGFNQRGYNNRFGGPRRSPGNGVRSSSWSICCLTRGGATVYLLGSGRGGAGELVESYGASGALKVLRGGGTRRIVGDTVWTGFDGASGGVRDWPRVGRRYTLLL